MHPLKQLMTVTFCFCCFAGGSQAGPIQQVLRSDAPQIRAVMDNPDAHEVQILFTEIVRGSDGQIELIEDEFEVADGRYHYPASTVKFPVALLALERLLEDPRIDRYSRFVVEGENVGTSVTNELIKLFVISDNNAYNRLFEFLGKDDINSRLADKRLNARISHRLSVPESDALTTKPLYFSQETGTPIRVGPTASRPIAIPDVAGLEKGIAYYENGSRIEAPFDFSEKNFLPLRTLHAMLTRLVLPERFTPAQRFSLSEAQRQFVLSIMQRYPRETGFDPQEYPDGYGKFLILGDSVDPAPPHLKIANKSGWAYGYLTDTAYIRDTRSGREFIISASIHVNANQTFNDDEYEYEELGVPFLAELGRALITSERPAGG
ncbi:MAG: serine hydrolase [Pseudohongiellaceae bacterium]